MKKGSTLFLKVILLLIGLGVLAGMLWFPPNEGAAQGKDLLSIYLNPFILFIYIGSTPFFFGLYQAFKLLNLIDANKAFSKASVNAFKNMKYASLTLIGFIATAVAFIHLFVAKGDDPAGPTMLGFLVSLVLTVIATAAAIFQKLFQNAVDLKKENDLTV